MAKRGNISEVLQPRLPHNWKLVVVGLQSEPSSQELCPGQHELVLEEWPKKLRIYGSPSLSRGDVETNHTRSRLQNILEDKAIGRIRKEWQAPGSSQNIVAKEKWG